MLLELLPPCGIGNGRPLSQLKSRRSPIYEPITDGAYDAMMNAIRRDELPSMYFMQYEISGRDAALRRPRTAGASRPYQHNRTSQCDVPVNEIIWTVRNLLLVPHFAFPPSNVVVKKPIVFNGQQYNSLDELPPEVRQWVAKMPPPNPGESKTELEIKTIETFSPRTNIPAGWTKDEEQPIEEGSNVPWLLVRMLVVVVLILLFLLFLSSRRHTGS